MTLKELRAKCLKEGKDIYKIAEKPARMYKVRHRSEVTGKYIYHTYLRRKCSICKKENMVDRSVYYRSNKGRAKQSGNSFLGIAKRNFCSQECRVKGISGKNHYMFEEGKIVDNNHSDYIQVLTRKHPHRTKSNHVPLHRWIMEKHIGRYLKPVVRYKNGKIKDHGELVHHIDMDKHHNKIPNLMICNGMGHHMDIHATFNGVCKDLMKKGIVKFNQDKGYYLAKGV